MNIESKEITLVRPSEVKLNPKNRNKHPKEQIERLAEIIKYQGFRDPIIISNRSGFCSAGEGRTYAARMLGLEYIPAIYQDFNSEEQETAFGISHNAISAWAELDFSGINLDVPDLGPDFDINLLGIKDFMIDLAEVDLPDLGDGKDSMIIQRTFTLSTEQSDFLDEALNLAKSYEDCSDEINENGPGCQLAAMAKAYALSKRN